MLVNYSTRSKVWGRELTTPCVTSLPRAPYSTFQHGAERSMSKQWKEQKSVNATSLRKCSLLLRAPTTTENDTSKLWSIACGGAVLTSNIRLCSQRAQLRSTRGQVEGSWNVTQWRRGNGTPAGKDYFFWEVIISVCFHKRLNNKVCSNNWPMTQKGFLAKRSRPCHPL